MFNREPLLLLRARMWRKALRFWALGALLRVPATVVAFCVCGFATYAPGVRLEPRPAGGSFPVPPGSPKGGPSARGRGGRPGGVAGVGAPPRRETPAPRP